MSDRPLKYHQTAFDLLGVEPELSKAAAVTLWQREQALGVTFPPSVREWYSVEGAVAVLAAFSNQDQPIPVEQLGETYIYDDEPDPYNPLSRQLLHIMTENQGVCQWAIDLDGSGDPPVLVHVDETPGWQLHAEHFSIFTAVQVWDWSREQALGAQDQPLAERDVAFLQDTFQEAPRTYRWPGEVNYRFYDESSRILIRDVPELQADWYISAESELALLRLAARIWHCGSLAASLYGLNGQGASVLKQLRPDSSA